MYAITKQDIAFARHVAYKVGGRVDAEERVSDAYYGLCVASQDFNPGRGAQFRTWAYHKIRAAMQEGYRKRNQWFCWTGHAIGKVSREPLEDGSYLPDVDEMIDFLTFFKRLRPRERTVVKLRLYGYSSKEIGAKLGLRRETVWKILCGVA